MTKKAKKSKQLMEGPLDDALAKLIVEFLESNTGTRSRTSKLRILESAVTSVKNQLPKKSREELVEMMADEIEDLISQASGEARSEAEQEGDVDDDMCTEALEQALERTRSWA